MAYIESRWTQLLLSWLSKCVSTSKVSKLNPKILADVMAKYNKDICTNDFDRAMLSTDDVEQFIKYKYPILRLQYLYGECDITKRLYVLTSMILYHCCMSSKTGAVDEDICKELSPYEQELILKFCENLCSMAATVHNVENAIKDAFEIVGSDPEGQSDYLNASAWSDTAPQTSCVSTIKESIFTLASDETSVPKIKALKDPDLNYTSSITVMPSIISETSTYSELTDFNEIMTPEMYMFNNSIKSGVYTMGTTDKPKKVTIAETSDSQIQNDMYTYVHVEEFTGEEELAESKHKIIKENCKELKEPDKMNNVPYEKDPKRCKSNLCKSFCMQPGSSKDKTHNEKEKEKKFFDTKSRKKWKMYAVAMAVLLFIILSVVACIILFTDYEKNIMKLNAPRGQIKKLIEVRQDAWQCIQGLCEKANQSTKYTVFSYNRCFLICMGPQLWPYPTGNTFYSNKIIGISTRKLAYVFKAVPSEAVHRYLNEALKLFLKDLANLEEITDEQSYDIIGIPELKMLLQIYVESNPEPRLRLNTEEAYHLKIDTFNDHVVVNLSSSSFCGVRHGLETLKQMILLDHSTGKLITLSKAEVSDAPSYKYRGLMIDTARNYIAVPDLMRTIDAMATVKLNTFHWRISDVTSFPLLLLELPKLFEYGAYDRTMVYTKEDVRNIVHRAGIRGIRVLIEVAAPGPLGRPWSWNPDVTCPVYNNNDSCGNVLCLRMNMKKYIFDTLRTIYTEILEMTKVDDIFHLSDGIFSLSNCFNLIEDREGFLDKALIILTLANKGFLPELPVVWYTPHLMKDYEARAWDGLGVQLNEMKQHRSDNSLLKFKVIHSAKWDLSCEMMKQRCVKYRTWQEMYSWKSWRNIEVLSIEGGEAVLWTDLVNSANLDSHIWPRAAAVAERLWSDVAINSTATSSVYIRLDIQRWRMLFQGINAQPVWPLWCSLNPAVCLEKLNSY